MAAYMHTYYIWALIITYRVSVSVWMSNQLQGILASGGYLVEQLKPNEEKKTID